MRFATKTINVAPNKTQINKTYTCPICGYVVEESMIDGTTTKITGDVDFIIFPFKTMVTLDGLSKELCACPKCNSIQYVEYCFD